MCAIANEGQGTADLATVADSVFDRLRRRIARGEMPPGTWLRQRPLARELGVSPMPVVEALRRLQATGLVEAVPKWGVRVRVITVEQWEQLALMRAALEGLTVHRLAERAPEKAGPLAELRERASELDRLLNEPRSDRRPMELAVDLDLAFHRRVAELSGLTLVLEQLDRQALIERVLVVTRWEIDRSGRRFDSSPTHVELVDAITLGDADAAERLIRRTVGPRREMLDHLRAIYGDGPIVCHPPSDEGDADPA